MVLQFLATHLNELDELASLLNLDVHVGHVNGVSAQWVWQAVFRVSRSLKCRFNSSVGSHCAGVVEGGFLGSFSALTVV